MWYRSQVAWRRNKDPLFRGDSAAGVSTPDPSSSTGIVAHILYLGGAGRRTPFHSASESEDTALYFAGLDGKVYRTHVRVAEDHAVHHIGQQELLRVLRGKGFGRAKWGSALEVMQARRYVEQWAEHLLDFSDVPPEEAGRTAAALYAP